MKVFISHKNTDQYIARRVLEVLKSQGVDAYLDLLDNTVVYKGELLTKHIKSKLNECTDILVVMSEETRYSWWVPFEIGMATQKDLPTVSYLQSGVELPDYLAYWPRLKNETDLLQYVVTRRYVQQQTIIGRSLEQSSFSNNTSETERFYTELKQRLR